MKPGIYTRDQLTNEAYHAAPGISKSGLDLVARSPAHYAYAAPRESTRAMEVGTAIHCSILEPDRFATDYMMLREVTDRRASAYKEACKVWSAERVLTGTEADKVAGMQESVRSNRHLADFLGAPGQCELSVFATDPETGVLVKCRFDKLLDSHAAVDLKKTQDIRDFGKSVANYGYHIQAAFYSDVYEWATGEKLDGFVFAAVEEVMPHASAPFFLDDEAMEIGRIEYRKALNTYAECLASDEWPGIECEPQEIQLPYWYMNKFDDIDETLISEE